MKKLDLIKLHIGYVPYTSDFSHPADKRRFVSYAKIKGIKFSKYTEGHVYDIVVLSEKADLSIWHKRTDCLLVYDLIDDYLNEPTFSFKTAFRGLYKYFSREHRWASLSYKNLVKKTVINSSAIVCTSLKQKNIINRYNPNTHIVLDIHSQFEVERCVVKKNDEPLKIIWEGLASNLIHLVSLKAVFEQLNVAIELHVVTDIYVPHKIKKFRKKSEKYLKHLPVKLYFYTWNENNLKAVAENCHLAIIPLDLRVPLAAGKPENKLILLMKMGLPVITSPNESYVRVLSKVSENLICRTDADWIKVITRLSEDENLRMQLAIKGLTYVKNFYDTKAIVESWDRVFNSLNASKF